MNVRACGEPGILQDISFLTHIMQLALLNSTTGKQISRIAMFHRL
jgi:hypothetical protein